MAGVGLEEAGKEVMQKLNVPAQVMRGFQTVYYPLLSITQISSMYKQWANRLTPKQIQERTLKLLKHLDAADKLLPFSKDVVELETLILKQKQVLTDAELVKTLQAKGEAISIEERKLLGYLEDNQKNAKGAWEKKRLEIIDKYGEGKEFHEEFKKAQELIDKNVEGIAEQGRQAIEERLAVLKQQSAEFDTSLQRSSGTRKWITDKQLHTEKGCEEYKQSLDLAKSKGDANNATDKTAPLEEDYSKEVEKYEQFLKENYDLEVRTEYDKGQSRTNEFTEDKQGGGKRQTKQGKTQKNGNDYSGDKTKTKGDESKKGNNMPEPGGDAIDFFADHTAPKTGTREQLQKIMKGKVPPANQGAILKQFDEIERLTKLAEGTRADFAKNFPASITGQRTPTFVALQNAINGEENTLSPLKIHLARHINREKDVLQKMLGGYLPTEQISLFTETIKAIKVINKEEVK